MKAIIMAGGEGTRLRPLTCDTPKPMMRLMNKPIIDYSLELLSMHGVSEAAITLGYLPERIRDHLGDSSHGVTIKYYTERRPMGTAGGVKQARDFLTETFCVLSGDGVTDCDLTVALEFHKNHGAKATMVLKRVPDPTAYGLVMTAPDGRITRFVEKPGWGEVVSDTINTGIYILEPEILDMIPDGAYDFGSQLFPALASQGLLYGHITDAYWCDIGDVPAYLRMCRDALDGLISLPSLSAHRKETIISEGAHIHPTARIEAPCFISPGVRIEKNARIGAYSIVEADAHVGPHADIKRSVVWPGAHISEGAQLRGCVLGRNAQLAACVRVYENCAVGTGAVIGVDSEVAPDVSIWPGKHVGEAMLAASNLVWGGGEPACFHDGILLLSTPSEALHAAQACAAALRPDEILVGRSHSPNSDAIWHLCAAGLMAQGIQVIDAGPCTLPQLRYAMDLMRTEYGIMVSENSISPLTNFGAPVSQSTARSICAYMARQDFPRAFRSDARPVIHAGSSSQPYISMLASAFCADPAPAMPAAVHCEDPSVLEIAAKAFNRASLSARFETEADLMELFPGEIGIWLSPDGTSVRFSHQHGMLTGPQTELLVSWTALERGERRLLLHEHATRAINELADRSNAEVIRISGDRAAYKNALTESRTQFRLHTDGIYLALCVLSALTENALTLTGWLSTMPKVHRAEKRIHLDNSIRGSVLRQFGENHSLDLQNANAWITPDSSRPECTVCAESYTMEAARELCDFCAAELEKLAGKDTNA